jgi:hypothetical protein
VKTKVDAGKYYGVTPTGRMVQVPAATPDVVICRRVADFPANQPPAGAALEPCARCGEVIAFNPHGPYPDRPRACQRCCGIEPLPFGA